jgi:hypothetical protein
MNFGGGGTAIGGGYDPNAGKGIVLELKNQQEYNAAI